MNDMGEPFKPQAGNLQASGAPAADVPPTEDERTFAMLAEVLQIFAGFIPPLVIYFVKRNSRFVAFHSLQALFWQITRFVIMMIGMWIIIISIVGVTMRQLPKGPALDAFPVGIFMWMGSFWLIFMILTIVNLIVAIYYGIQAYQGKWAAYPILGRWARKIVDS